MIKKSKGKHCVSLFIDRNVAAYFDFFVTEYIHQEVLNKIRHKSITHNIFRIQDNESIMCRFYCISFIEYMLDVVRLYRLISLNECKKNAKIIYKYSNLNLGGG